MVLITPDITYTHTSAVAAYTALKPGQTTANDHPHPDMAMHAPGPGGKPEAAESCCQDHSRESVAGEGGSSGSAIRVISASSHQGPQPQSGQPYQGQ